MRISGLVLAVAFFLLHSFTFAQSTQTVFVDDAELTVSYVVNTQSGNSRWAAIDSKNLSAACPDVGCWSTHLDASRTYGGTWHEGVDLATAAYIFTGTGVDVYFVFRDWAGALTNTSFFIDGQVMGNLLKMGSGDESTWIYNFKAFSISDLPNAQHELLIVDGSPSAIVFDYLSYTKVIPAATSASVAATTIPQTVVPTSELAASLTTALASLPASTSSTPSSAPLTTTTGFQNTVLIGSLAAAIVVALILVGLSGFLWWRRRQRREAMTLRNVDLAASPPPSPTPFRFPQPSSSMSEQRHHPRPPPPSHSGSHVSSTTDGSRLHYLDRDPFGSRSTSDMSTTVSSRSGDALMRHPSVAPPAYVSGIPPSGTTRVGKTRL